MESSTNRTNKKWPKIAAGLLSWSLTVTPAFGQNLEKEGKAKKANTASLIKHVIVLIGENRTFDHVFATYKPRHGQSVSNLLSRGIINADGSPGPNAADATQFIVNTLLPSHY